MFKIYLAEVENPDQDNYFNEYITIRTGSENNYQYKWELLGTTKVDISGLYSKPSGGIPKTDLASAVQTSLGKADSALQSSDIVQSPINGNISIKGTTIISTTDPGGSSSPMTGVTWAGLNNLEKKIAIQSVIPSSGAATISAEAGNYYKVTDTVTSLTISLPNVSQNNTYISSFVVFFETGSNPTVTITPSTDVLYYSGYQIDSNTSYELNFMYNGTKWIVAYATIG